MKTFTLTGEHIKLLKASYITWYDFEFGAPGIDCKRPYGNSSVEADIAGILGWPVLYDAHEERHALTEEQEDRARELHRELQTALQVVLATSSFRPGDYRMTKSYNKTSWAFHEEL